MFYINKFILTKKKIGYKIFENKRFITKQRGFYLGITSTTLK